MQIASVTIGGVSWTLDDECKVQGITHELSGGSSSCEILVTCDPRENAVVGSAVVGEAFVGHGLVPQLEVIVTDTGGAIQFGGYVSRIRRVKMNQERYSYALSCRDYTMLLDGVVIESELFTSRGDREIIQYLFSTYMPSVDTSEVEDVGTVDSLEITDQTLRAALDAIKQRTGAEWYLDFDKKLQYHAPDAHAAAFGLSDAPDGVTTFAFLLDSFLPEEDFASPANVITVIGRGDDVTATVAQVKPAADADCGYVFRSGNVYPPEVGNSSVITSAGGNGMRSASPTTPVQYDVGVSLLRFDTSVLPDDATITAATLKLYVTDLQAHAATAPEVGIQYYDPANWPVDSSDYLSTAPSCDAMDYRALSGFSTGWQSFPLDVAGINVGGYTAFRMHLRGDPVGTTSTNRMTFSGYAGGSNMPVLEVAYTYAANGAKATYTDAASVAAYGEFRRTIVERSIVTDNEALARAQREAAQYAWPRRSATVSFDRDGIKRGDYLPLSAPASGIDERLIVRKLQMRWPGLPDRTLYTADCGDYKPDLVRFLLGRTS